MFTGISIPDLGPLSGVNDDGVILGTIAPSSLTSVQSESATSDAVYAVRLNADPNFVFTDVSAAIGDDAADDVNPFGLDAEFSANDALYIACDHDISELYVRVSTSGVWAGTGIAIFDSADGITAGRQLTGVVDDSDGFRNAPGIYRIRWTAPATARVAHSPVPGHVASRRWIVIKPVGFTGVTAAPRLSRVWLRHATEHPHHTVYSGIANGGFTSNVFGGAELISVFFAGGTSLYACGPGPSVGLDLNIFRRLGAVITYVWEYLASDDTWKPLTGISDPSNGMTNGPAVLGAVGVEYKIRWSIPADWTSRSLELHPNPAVAGYWVRRRLLTVAPPGPYPIQLIRSRVKALGAGNATGVKHRVAKAYTRLQVLRIGVPPVTDLVGQVINVATGAGSAFTIPAGTQGPVEIALANTVTVEAGGQALVMHASGGEMQDVVVNFVE